MLLTLENIQNQQFNQRFRGYDMAEVDAFLDKIAESYLFVSTENGKLKEELSALKNAQNQSLEEEQSFKNAIISAQSFADDIKNKAETRAARLQEDAKEKSTAILEEAQAQVKSLEAQIMTLGGEKERIKDELRSFLQTYLSKVDEDSPSPQQAAAPVETVSMDQFPGLVDIDEPVVEPEPEAPALEREEPIAQDDDDSPGAHDDIAILYEKIDLADDFSLDELSALEETESAPVAEATPDFAPGDLDDLDMPDLDGDMLYSLEDPLDNPGPAVVIDPLQDEDK